MNRIQRSIASVAGLSSVIEAQNDRISDLVTAKEATTTEIAFLERKLDEFQYMNLLEMSEGEWVVLPAAKRKEVIRRLRILRHENPIAKQAIKLIVRFTLGRGISGTPKDERSKEIFEEFWYDEVNQAILTEHQAMQTRLDEKATDGEKFYSMFPTPGIAPYVRLGEIPMEEIHDIIYDPDNRHVPVFYKRISYPKIYDATLNQGTGGWKPVVGATVKPDIKYYRDYRITDEYLAGITGLVIPERMIVQDAVVYHSLINGMWTKSGFRGVSELFASREWIRVFKEFVEDRAAINAAANSISYIRKVKGGQTAVASVSGKVGGVTVGQDQELPRTLSRPVPGSVVDANEAIDYSTIRADTGAVDAKEDAQLILVAAGSGVSTNAQYFGEGGDANLATAQAMELPMVKSYEDWQQGLQADLQRICDYVQMVARGFDSLSETPSEFKEIDWQFPPIVAEDVVKYTSAWAQIAQQIASGNPKVREIAIRGALSAMHVPNLDSLMEDINTEEEILQQNKEEMRQMQLLGLTGSVPPGQDQPNDQNQKAGGSSAQGQDPDTARLSQGKSPRIPFTGPRKL